VIEIPDKVKGDGMVLAVMVCPKGRIVFSPVSWSVTICPGATEMRFTATKFGGRGKSFGCGYFGTTVQAG